MYRPEGMVEFSFGPIIYESEVYTMARTKPDYIPMKENVDNQNISS